MFYLNIIRLYIVIFMINIIFINCQDKIHEEEDVEDDDIVVCKYKCSEGQFCILQYNYIIFYHTINNTTIIYIYIYIDNDIIYNLRNYNI